MQFDDDFTLAAGQTMKLQLFCDMTLAPPNGLNDAFAVDIGLPNNIAAVEPPPSYAPITVTLPSPNGNPPRAYVLLTQ
ncbi:hypothetical protein A3I45_03750 [Candidatus Uhrbacteria bacterium RIFCSPLOWO2_02_FULL_53_10]|nr:MAG: hypothetical protein A3I45_03750 [Candidatus Uhrbacteria bacterium RIFCSPLOWO2_02_FULL_53_10]